MELQSGKPLVVTRPKDAPSLITISATIQFIGEIKDRLDNMSREESESLISDLCRDLARYRIDYRGLDLPLQAIQLKTNFPITENISEYELLEKATFVESAIILCTERISRIKASNAEQPHEQKTV